MHSLRGGPTRFRIFLRGPTRLQDPRLSARRWPLGSCRRAPRRILPLHGFTAIIAAVISALIRSMRPRQWVKNVFVFAALVFDRRLSEPQALLVTALGFILLSAISSSVYLLNDIADLEADRAHPIKRNRPLAAGELPVSMAWPVAALLVTLSLGGGFALNVGFGLILAGYLLMNLLYSYWMKHIPIIDVFVLAAGFVIRVGAGVALISPVERFSPWLYVCTTLLALFLGFGKRRAEMMLMQASANTQRRVLEGYSLDLLDELLVIAAATTIMAYSLYTFSAENLPESHLMMLTIPFVMYGFFRYLHLIHVEGKGGAPEEMVLRDRPLQSAILLWGLSSALILYFGT